MKAIGYSRVSTDEQAKHGVSLDNQAEQIKKYCHGEGFELIRMIEDAGISGGKNRARPGFIQLLDAVDQHRVDVIVIYSLERLSRDMLTLLSLERLLADQDIQLHTIDGRINTSTPDGFMSFAMKAFMGEMERRQVKHRTRKAMQYKKDQGQVVGSIPYGYKRTGDTLKPIKTEQDNIKRAVDLHATGARLADIIRIFNSEGRKTRSGKDWNSQQVKRILPEYQPKWRKGRTRISQATRLFLEAVA
jgi:site-specific DNA recombinase